MLPISDILVRSICAYAVMAPIIALYFVYLKKAKKEVEHLHITAVFAFCYYLFSILTVTVISYTSTIAFRPKISLIPFLGMKTGPTDTLLNIVLFVPLDIFAASV